MRGRRKTIEESNLIFLNDYVGKKTLKPDEFRAMMADQEADVEGKVEEFKEVMATQDLDAINAWFGSNISGKAWRTLWLAEKSREHRRANPRSEQTIHKELAEGVKKWSGASDINDAVRLYDFFDDRQ